MNELRDYSGAFDPHLKYENFSKEFLVELLNAYSGYILRLDGFWYFTVKGRKGDDEAFACDTKVWEKMQLYELKMVCKLFKIKGNDVAAMMKAMQMSPWMRIYTYEMQLENPNHGTITISHCPTLLALEREGEGREQRICQVLEPKLFRLVADFFNPKIEIRGIKVPPRRDRSGIACQWDFSLK